MSNYKVQKGYWNSAFYKDKITVKDAIDSMTEDQKKAMYILVEKAAAKDGPTQSSAQALKMIINPVYGLPGAKFRNIDAMINRESICNVNSHVVYNKTKGVTVLIFDNNERPVVKVKLIKGNEFNLEKAILYLILKSSGMSSNEINKLYSQLTFTKLVGKNRKPKQFLYTDKFYEYLLLNKYQFKEEELHKLMSSMWNPEKDLETSFLYFLVTKRCFIPKEVVERLLIDAVPAVKKRNLKRRNKNEY